MKSKVFILYFTILLIFGQIVFGQEKGVGNQTVSKLPAKEKRWALIIGVSQYEDGNITPLPGANNDARGLRDALREYAGFDEKQIITLMTDESKDRQPTKNNILRYLGNLSGTVPKDGLLLVAFSGHGIERQKQAFLLASDTPYSDNVKVLERTALSVSDDFKELIRDTGVGQVIILLDACRNDPSSGRSSSDNPLTQAYKEGFSFDVRNKEVEAFATLYATSIGERAYEYTRENKGYFTWAFIEGLKGGAANSDSEVTLGNLIRYVEKYVPQQVKIDLGSNKLQRPFSIIEGYKAEELVLGIAKNVESKTSNYYIYSSEFKRIANKLVKYYSVSTFSEGLAFVRISAKDSAFSYGFVNQFGDEVIPLRYASASDFSEGLALVASYSKETGFLHGFIDKNGKEVIPLKFEDADSFSEGLAKVAMTDFSEKDSGEFGPPLKFGFIDKTGKIIIPLKFYDANSFSQGSAPVFDGRKWLIIDRFGKIVIPKNDDTVISVSNGLLSVGSKGDCTLTYKSGVVRKIGERCFEISEGMIEFESAGKYGFINTQGEIVSPPKYDSAFSFSNGYAWVWIGSKTGFIDKLGREVVPVKYETSWCSAFQKLGIFGVTYNGKKGFVDIYGNEYFDF